MSFAEWDPLARAHRSRTGGLQRPIAAGVPAAGCGSGLCLADADKLLLPQPGVCEGGRCWCTGCLAAVIWYCEGELGACTGGPGLWQEEGKGVISRRA